MSKTIKVMYHGERVSMIGDVYQLFKDRKGQDYRFRGIKHVSFRAVYPMNGNTMERTPERYPISPWFPTDKEELEYEAQKLVVKQYRQTRKKDLQLRQPHEKIVRAVALLRPFYLSMGEIDRQRFMKWVSNECSKKGKK